MCPIILGWHPHLWIFHGKALNKNLNFKSNYNNLDLRDLAAPSLKTLVCFAQSNRLVRRYLRYTILPPLKGEDLKKRYVWKTLSSKSQALLKTISNRPEEGNTLRNKFCRLFTSPDTSLATMAADLLFVLCKEKGQSYYVWIWFSNVPNFNLFSGAFRQAHRLR